MFSLGKFLLALRFQLYIFQTSLVHPQELLCRDCICRLRYVVIRTTEMPFQLFQWPTCLGQVSFPDSLHFLIGTDLMPLASSLLSSPIFPTPPQDEVISTQQFLYTYLDDIRHTNFRHDLTVPHSTRWFGSFLVLWQAELFHLVLTLFQAGSLIPFPNCMLLLLLLLYHIVLPFPTYLSAFLERK